MTDKTDVTPPAKSLAPTGEQPPAAPSVTDIKKFGTPLTRAVAGSGDGTGVQTKTAPLDMLVVMKLYGRGELTKSIRTPKTFEVEISSRLDANDLNTLDLLVADAADEITTQSSNFAGGHAVIEIARNFADENAYETGVSFEMYRTHPETISKRIMLVDDPSIDQLYETLDSAVQHMAFRVSRGKPRLET